MTLIIGPTMSLDALIEYEKYADDEVEKLSIWKKPIRSVLSLIYLSADGQYVGERFRRRSKRSDEVGTAIISRMSYVMSHFPKCRREIGADIDDALSVFDKIAKDDISKLLGYTQFCEIMPLVRRGFFTVESKSGGFVLEHPSVNFRDHEELDILMSELVLAHDLAPPPYPIEKCEKMVKALPNLPGDELAIVLKDAFEHYLENVFEIPLLSDEAFMTSFTFTREDFLRIRAALMSYADFCLGMADAAERLALRAVTRPRKTALAREVREWAAPLLSRNHIIGVAAGLATVDPDAAEMIVDAFSIDLKNLEGVGGGEGFFPPFLRLDNSLLFSPHAVKRMMPERNLLYSLNSLKKQGDTRFDNVVSEHLEPALLDDAVECISQLPGVEIRPNVNWEHGEVDLIAYHAGSNSALQIQAKAAVPPQGARMTAQIESRTVEAAKQINRFLELGDNKKDAICSRAIGRQLKGVSWSSGILVRTCLGTEKAWDSIEGFAPLNPILLKSAIKKLLKQKDFSLEDLVLIASEELQKLKETAIVGWEQKSFSLFEKDIKLPLLDLNHTAIGEFRDRALG